MSLAKNVHDREGIVSCLTSNLPARSEALLREASTARLQSKKYCTRNLLASRPSHWALRSCCLLLTLNLNGVSLRVIDLNLQHDRWTLTGKHLINHEETPIFIPYGRNHLVQLCHIQQTSIRHLHQEEIV